MSNPYRQVNIRPREPYQPEEHEVVDMTLGARGDVHLKDLEGGETYLPGRDFETVPSENVRPVKGGIQLDYGRSLIDSISHWMFNLAEHAFIDRTGSERRHILALGRRSTAATIFRAHRKVAGDFVLDGEVSGLAAIGTPAMLSHVSSLNVLTVAWDGFDNLLVRLEDIDILRTQRDDFATGVLSEEGDTRTASLTLPAGSIEDFLIHYSVKLDVYNVDRVRVRVRALRWDSSEPLGDEITAQVVRTYTELAGNLLELEDSLLLGGGSGDEIRLEIELLDVDGLNFTPTPREVSFADAGSGTPRYHVAKGEAPPAVGNEYTFNFRLDTSITEFVEVPVQLLIRPGGSGPWIQVEEVFAFAHTPYSRTIIKEGLDENTQFGIHIQNEDPDDPDFTLILAESNVIWTEATPLEDIGYVVEIDPAHVEYDFLDDVTGILWEEIEEAPKARWVDAFADRLIALWDDGDKQMFSWSQNGRWDRWTGAGSGQTVLGNTRTEPLGALQGTALVTHNVLAVFRSASITRAYRTGQLEPAIGFQPWIEGVGCEAPRTIVPTPAGVIFLGHDGMVYILREGGLVPVGEKVHEYIYSLCDGFTVDLQATADYISERQEYVLQLKIQNGVIELTMDLKPVLKGQEPRWFLSRYGGNIQRYAVLSVQHERTHYLIGENIFEEDLDSVARSPLGPAEGMWFSPPLGAAPHHHTIHNLQKLSIFVEYAKSTHDPAVDGDIQVLFSTNHFHDNSPLVPANWFNAQERRRVESWENTPNRRVERLTFYPASDFFPDVTQDWAGVMLQFGIKFPSGNHAPSRVRVLGYTWTGVRRVRDS